jgi:ribosomal protein S18 acetylase RimI-like enzyme
VTATALRLEQVDPLPLRDELRDVHRAALGAGALSEEWAGGRLPRHVTRPDFVFLVARDRNAVVGFGYGYTGSYGEWWTDRVAGALSESQRADWLDRPHFEVVELHVRPSAQRRGIGSALLAQLLSRQPHRRAVLTTRSASKSARRFYAKNGWEELAEVDFGRGYPPYVALGKVVRYLPATDAT